MSKLKKLSLKRTLVIILVMSLIIVAANFWPTNYYLESPGIAQELSSFITINNGDYFENIEGNLRLTAVSLESASVMDYYYVSLFRPEGVNLVPLEKRLPPGVEMEEYFEMMRDVMKESQLKAKAVALEKAGYETQISGQGAEVIKVLAESYAQGKLEPGDIIVEVDGQRVELVTEVVDLIQDREIGAEAELTVKRGDERLNFNIKTKELEDSPEQASLGILISSYQRSFDFPISIEIEAGEIGGPSAGMMFSLEILNRLTIADLTAGNDIAGTGTIDLEGKVGQISGVQQKVIAARKEGADFFLAPVENYQTAQEVAEGIEVVSIADIEEAIAFLDSLK
ncbi:YlbL family protein [Fuchsiella alkaliacetigena]|uniref:YlbL family protein n=1 Tax=Fuchsiella alkaliacetigena TaxID=957042 RepID=UPI00200B06FC|nr:S16 family serine protease [Fuchsiella alkaliacetigena]MCK8823964.1 PDZ domain-containing protein [Fuchsiella alkaliacetigena]